MQEGVQDVREAEESQQHEEVDVLQQVVLLPRREGIQAEQRIAHYVRVLVCLIRIDVVLHHMLQRREEMRYR